MVDPEPLVTAVSWRGASQWFVRWRHSTYGQATHSDGARFSQDHGHPIPILHPIAMRWSAEHTKRVSIHLKKTESSDGRIGWRLDNSTSTEEGTRRLGSSSPIPQCPFALGHWDITETRHTATEGSSMTCFCDNCVWWAVEITTRLNKWDGRDAE